MDTTISLYTLMLGLIAGLALLTLIVRLGTQKHAALAWLAAALGLGAVNTWLFAKGGSGLPTRAALYLFDPATLYFVTQSIRVALKRRKSSSTVTLTVISLALLSLVLLAIGAPVRFEAVPAMIAGLVAYGDALNAIWRSERNFVRTGLLASMSVMVVTDIVRMPFFPSLLEGGKAFPGLGRAWLPEFLLVATSFAVPTVVLFIIAAIVGQVIGTYRHRSERDAMTDLLQRRTFSEAIREADPSLGVLVVADIDLFKEVNDTYGHGVGDDVIRHFASLMRNEAPIAARLGGEEFAIALPGKSIGEGREIAEALRERFAEYRHNGMGPERKLTASFGVAPYNQRVALAESLDRADRALYRAKRSGRNCVALFGTDQMEREEGGLAFG